MGGPPLHGYIGWCPPCGKKLYDDGCKGAADVGMPHLR